MLRHHVRAALLACCLAAALTGPAWAAKDIPPVVPAGTTLVLRPGANPHRLQANTTTVVSAGATLICRPGVIVEAGADAVLAVDGTLTAQGRPARKVVFTADSAHQRRGGWGGIQFRTNESSASKLTNCVIEWAGSGTEAGVLCSGSLTVAPQPTLTRCEIREIAGDGIRNVGAAPKLAACSIHDCTNCAILNLYGGYAYFINPCQASGNGSDTETFHHEGHGLIFPETWRPAGFPYRVLGRVGTQDGGKLTIEPGVEILVGPDADLIADRGPIIAQGTARKPIVIKSLSGSPGGWGGIYVYQNGAGSVFRHCQISGGGQNGEAHLLVRDARLNGGVTLDHTDIAGGAASGLYLWNAVVQLTNSSVRGHAGWGITAASNTKLTITASDITKNAQDGAAVQARALSVPTDAALATASGAYLYDTNATIADSTINRNGGWGLVCAGSTQLQLQHTQVIGNGQDGVYNASTSSVQLTPNNTLARNGGYDVVNASSRSVPAQSNFWGVTTEAQIAQRIYDGNDACCGVGKVIFKPFLTSRPAALAADSSAELAFMSATAAPTASGAVQITYVLSADATVQAEVLNLAGRPVRTLVTSQPATAGANVLLWDQRSQTGTRAPSGMYLICLRAASPSGQLAQTLTPVRTGAR